MLLKLLFKKEFDVFNKIIIQDKKIAKLAIVSDQIILRIQENH